MQIYKKFYFISMYVISSVLAVVYSVALLYILFRHLFPILRLIKEAPSDNSAGIGSFLALLIFLCILFIFLTFFLVVASRTFKGAKKYTELELITERKNLFGYGIFTAITFAPTILGLIAMLVFVIYTNDHILELQKEYTPVEEHKTKFPKKKLRLDKNTKTLMERIEILKEMKEQGLITEEEYLTKKKDLLEM